MLAKLTRDLPEGDGLFYEPKWDGFRCIVFRDGDDVVLGSRNEKPLTRYFPELVAALGAQLPERCVVDGEIVIAGPARPRLRRPLAADPPGRLPGPAAGRDHARLVRRLRPAGPRRPGPAARSLRRAAAGRSRRRSGRPGRPIHLTPVTTSPETARDWFSRFEGAGLDGVVAKAGDLPTSRTSGSCSRSSTSARPTAWSGASGGTRRAAWSARCCSACSTTEERLHHVGVASGFSAARRAEFVATLELRTGRRRCVATPGCPTRRRTAASPGARAGGTRARTSVGSRCGPSWWSRSATTTCRATGSATPPRSSGGGPTATPPRAPTPSSTARSRPSSRRCSGPRSDRLTQLVGQARRRARPAPGRGSGGRRARTPAVGPRHSRAATPSSSPGSSRRVASTPEQLGLLAAAGQRRGQPGRSSHARPQRRVPVGRIVGDPVEGAVVGQHRRGRPPAPPGQPGEAVGAVADERQPVRDRPRGHPELLPHPGLVAQGALPAVELDHPLTDHALGQVLVRGADHHLVHGRVLRGDRRRRGQGVVGLELDHRPQRHPQGARPPPRATRTGTAGRGRCLRRSCSRARARCGRTR